MTPTTPPSKTVRDEALKRLGHVLLNLTPEERDQAVRIAAKLLAAKARNLAAKD
jgi:hypothetical protein